MTPHTQLRRLAPRRDNATAAAVVSKSLRIGLILWVRMKNVESNLSNINNAVPPWDLLYYWSDRSDSPDRVGGV